MPVKVYIWKKQKNSDTVGHASMSLSDQTHISWWPDTVVNKRVRSAPARKGQTLKDDIKFENSEPEAVYTIQMSPSKENEIKAWWNNFKATQHDYHLISQNCSTVVYLALRQAFPSLMLFAFMPVWIPAAIEQLAQWLGEGETTFEDKVQLFKSQALQEASEYLQLVSQ